MFAYCFPFQVPCSMGHLGTKAQPPEVTHSCKKQRSDFMALVLFDSMLRVAFRLVPYIKANIAENKACTLISSSSLLLN